MIRKYAAILAALIMALQFAACGNQAGQAGYESSAPDNTSGLPLATPSAAPEGTPFPDDATVEWPTGTARVTPQFTDEMRMCVSSAEEVDFPDCMSVALPEGLTTGDFNIYLSNGGGVPILNDVGMLCGCIEIHLYGSAIFENGELVGVAQFNNHEGFTGDFTPVSSGAPCVAVKYSKDVYDCDSGTSYFLGERSMWYAFWAKEGCDPIYAVYLFADLYD